VYGQLKFQASGKFRSQFGRFPSVKNTGWPEVFPSPSKVIASDMLNIGFISKEEPQLIFVLLYSK
jgi:hypothetical protein